MSKHLKGGVASSMGMSLLFVIGIVTLVACAPSTVELERHLETGAYDKAVKQVIGKDRMALELATLILGKHIQAKETVELIDVLSHAGKPGKRMLKRLLNTKSEFISNLAKIALYKNKEPEIDELMLVVNDDHSDVRHACIRAWYPHMTMVLLGRALIDHDPRVRRYAVQGVAGLGMEQDVSDLIKEALRLDPSSAVRAEAAKHGKLMGEDALQALKKALQDKSEGVRYAAIRGLAELEQSVAVKIIEDIAIGPVNHAMIVAAAELARLGNPLGKKRLNVALEDKRPEMRGAVLMRLERAELSDRAKILLKHLDDEDTKTVLLSARLLRKEQKTKIKRLTALKHIALQEGPMADEARDMLAVMGDETYVKKARNVFTQDSTAEDILAALQRLKDASRFQHDFVNLMASPDEKIRIEAAKTVIFSMSKI